MAVYLGDLPIGATLDHMFTTVDSSGVAAALDSTSIVSVFTGNSTTPNSSGVTLNVSFSTIVGLNHVRIVAASTSGYSSNTDNHIVIRTGTAGSKAMAGYMIGSFSIENRIIRTVTGNVNGNVSGNVSGSVGSVTGAVGSVTGAVGSVTGNVGGNVVGSVGSVAAGGIAAASFAAGAIDAAAIAANAIGASEVADGFLTAAKFSTGAITSSAVSANYLDAVWNSTIEGAVTARESLRLANSANGGLVSGAGTTSVSLRDLANTKNRVVAACDTNGNRSTITLDLA